MYLIVRLAIHLMNRAPEETINRKSPSKHALTGMVGAVTTKGGTGTQRAPVRCPYGLHTVKVAGHVPRPDRSPHGPRTVLPYRSRTVLPVWAPYRFAPTGPVLFCPYRSRTVLLVWAPYRFARTGLVPFCPHRPVLFCPYRSRTVLPVSVLYRFTHSCPAPFCPHVALTTPYQPIPPPYRFARTGPVPFCPHVAYLPRAPSWSRLLHPFHSFLTSSFGLPVLSTIFHSKFFSTIPLFYSSLLTAYFYLTSHSSVFIYNRTLLYMVLLTLCGHLQTQRVCRALHPVSGEDGILWLRSPVRSNTLLRPGLLLYGWLGWPDPINRLVVLCPNFH